MLPFPLVWRGEECNCEFKGYIDPFSHESKCPWRQLAETDQRTDFEERNVEE